MRDALLYSISANSAHGLPRTNADKRKAVALLLADSEWSQWSDREIARHCQVDHNSTAPARPIPAAANAPAAPGPRGPLSSPVRMLIGWESRGRHRDYVVLAESGERLRRLTPLRRDFGGGGGFSDGTAYGAIACGPPNPTESAAKPPKAEKSGAEKSEPAGAYFSAPDVSAFGFPWRRERGSEKRRKFGAFLSMVRHWVYEIFAGSKDSG